MLTAARRRTMLAIVLGLVVRALAGGEVPFAEAAGPCEALIGKWRWFTGGVVSINPNGTLVYDGGNDGTWECTDSARGWATLRWRLGGYVNRLALSGDGRGLSSTDPSQWYVTGQRIGAPRTVETPPPPKPAEPSRRPDPGPSAKPAPTAKAPEPKTAEPKPADPKVAAPTTPAPRAPDSKTVTPPADVKKADVPSRTPPLSPPPATSGPGRPGPCSGNACMQVAVETADRCVWLRSSMGDVVQAEVQLATETVKMTLERPDLAKVVKETRTTQNSVEARQAETKRRFDELRKKGHNIPYDPKYEGPLTPGPAKGPTADKSRAWHGTMYDPVWMKEYPVFHARIDRAGGCVTDPGEIRSYRVVSASAKEKDAAPSPPVVTCVGEACGDLDLAQIGTCQLGNRGRRQIQVGMFRKGNSHATVSAPLEAGETFRLPGITCMKADEIGRIEARYK